MATNPFRQVMLNERHYDYVEGSYSLSYDTKNKGNDAQVGRDFAYVGLQLPKHSITIALDNSYTPNLGSLTLGSTTWTGVSRLADLISYIDTGGASQPLTFVDIAGGTHRVIVTGTIDVSEAFDTPQEAGIEWRVNLTLENVS